MDRNANQNYDEILPHTIRMATIEEAREERWESVGKEVEELESLHPVDRNVKWKQYGGSSKN